MRESRYTWKKYIFSNNGHPALSSVVFRPGLDLAADAPPVQIAFEFAPAPYLDHDVIVDVKFYFNYMEVNEIFYDLKSSVPVRCQLDEFCHRK